MQIVNQVLSWTNVRKFFFFDATSHVITALAGLFLIISECSLFRTFFARNWPLLSPSHGFVTLGCSMIVLGLNMLGNMNKQATSQQSLGLPFWRLLLASGILSIVIGFFNIVAVRRIITSSSPSHINPITELRLPRQGPSHHLSHGSFSRRHDCLRCRHRIPI